MEITAKSFEELTRTEVYEILRARCAVFIVEQKCPYQDPDGTDYKSLHLFFRDDKGAIQAYLRLFTDEADPSTVHIGRVLTVSRGNGLGKKLLREGIRRARDIPGIRRIYLEAQVYAQGFYAQEGFRTCTEEFDEDGIPHIGMELAL